MINKNTYKTIFFDWNRTLSNSLFWNQLGDSEHERRDWHKNIVNFIFVEKKDLINNWMRGEFNEDYIAQLISKEFGYSKDVVISDLAESCKNMQLVSDEVLKFIDKIRNKGIKCVVATDNTDTFMKYTKPALKLENYFDDFLVSFDKKILKFNVKKNSIPFFDNYLKNNKLFYKDVLLIDDCIDESGTYKKLGFDILRITNSDNFLEELRKISDLV